MSHAPSRLLLIGYRGTGKSTVGALVAERLGWESVDSDDLIEQQTGRTIADIFAADGEAAFRAMEEQVVASLCEKDKTVISLGGGAVLSPATRERLKSAGPVAWLTAPPTALAGRLEADASTTARRPSLTGGGALEEIEQVLKLREPLYRECATIVVDTEGKPPVEVAAIVVERIRAAQ